MKEWQGTTNSISHFVNKADCWCEQALDMERELLTHRIAFKRTGVNGECCQDSSGGGQEEDALKPVELCWDLELWS